MMLYSFDVFDTVITRNTATPRGIFALMQERLLSDVQYGDIDEYIKRNFFHLRIQAEALAKKAFLGYGTEDITLEQIYAAIGMTGRLNDMEAVALARLERKTELEHIRGIKGNIRKVLELCRQGQRVVFISNMYLDCGTVRKMLHKADAALDQIPLYISSECKKIKNTGSLYRYVRDCEGALFEEWIHTGDNRKVDFDIPKSLGIQAVHYQYEPFLEWERDVIDRREEDVFIQLTVGASRNARLGRKEETEGTGPEKGIAYRVGTSIGACVLFPYVWWLLQESRKRGIGRLYFIARDGYILKQMADNIIEQNHWKIETVYLFGSREAWRIPAFIGGRLSMRQLIVWSHPSRIKTYGMLANALGLTKDELLTLLGLESKNSRQEISLLGMYNAVLLLEESESYWTLVKKKYRDRRKHTCSYLSQEINNNEQNYAFVEVAGSGFTQECLSELVMGDSQVPIRNFYFKLDTIPVSENCIFYNFIPSMMQFPLLIELLTRAPHEKTVDYEKRKGKWQPVFRGEEETAFLQYGLSDYIEGVLDFTQQYVGIVGKTGLYAEDLGLLLPYMEAMHNTKYPQLLGFFGDMPDSMTGWEKEPVCFAPRLTGRELKQYMQAGEDTFLREYKGSCLEYSLLRCTMEEKAVLEQGKTQIPPEKCGKDSRYRYWETERFPLELVGKKVVLYGGGKAGVDLYRRLTQETDAQVVLWADNQWRHCFAAQERKVYPAEEIKNVEYDQIIITVLDKDIAQKLKNELIQRGIASEKIMVINYSVRW